MLRCPPSRITLNSSDYAGLEQRMAARRHGRLNKPRQRNMRLSSGPGRSTILSVIPANENIGRERALSSSSQATLHDDSLCSSEVDPVSQEDRNVMSPHSDESRTPQEQVQVRPVVVTSRPRASTGLNEHGRMASQPLHSRHRSDDQRFRSHNVPDVSLPEHRTTGTTFDGTMDQCASSTGPSHRAELPMTRRGNSVLGEIHSDAYPSTGSRPRTFSSNLRPQTNRHDRSGQRSAMHHGLQGPQDDNPAQGPSRNYRPYEHAVIDILPDLEAAPIDHDRPLDPGAPSFVPRTRLVPTTSSANLPNVRLHAPSESRRDYHASRNLRVRSSAERNHHPPRLMRQHQPPASLLHASSIDLMGDQAPRSARHPTIREASSRAERDALFSSSGVQLIAARNQVPHPRVPSGSSRTSSSLLPTWSHHQDAPSTAYPSSYVHSNRVSLPGNGQLEVPVALSTTRPSSASSMSTPNLLQRPIAEHRVRSSSSSLTWRQLSSDPTAARRVPSMVSAASGISGGSRHPSYEGLNAAAEFLRMRSSPLDDLTERFSRLASSRPRSVGRSFANAPGDRRRISLLSGDIFRQDNAPRREQQQRSTPSTEAVSDPPEVSVFAEPTSSSSAATTTAQPLPPSSSPPATSDTIPGTLATHVSSTCKSRVPITVISPAQDAASPTSPIKREPAPTPSSSKVKVYTDSQAPKSQPRIPADLPSAKEPSEADVCPSEEVREAPIFVGRFTISSPPAIPQRQPHRHTYPTATVSQHDVQTPELARNNDSTAPPPRSAPPGRSRRPRAETRSRAQERVENEWEGHEEDLEGDRRTWMGRREDGSLDVTPPREGRFERYLS